MTHLNYGRNIGTRRCRGWRQDASRKVGPTVGRGDVGFGWRRRPHALRQTGACGILCPLSGHEIQLLHHEHHFYKANTSVPEHLLSMKSVYNPFWIIWLTKNSVCNYFECSSHEIPDPRFNIVLNILYFKFLSLKHSSRPLPHN